MGLHIIERAFADTRSENVSPSAKRLRDSTGSTLGPPKKTAAKTIASGMLGGNHDDDSEDDGYTGFAPGRRGTAPAKGTGYAGAYGAEDVRLAQYLTMTILQGRTADTHRRLAREQR